MKRLLLLAGNEHHRWHNWEETTKIISNLIINSGVDVQVENELRILSSTSLNEFDGLIQNYVNWNEPQGVSNDEKNGFLRFVNSGKGLSIIHYANGAFHYSLPGAEGFHWEEYHEIMGRSWTSDDKAEVTSQHDDYGKFVVEVVNNNHPITRGITNFETVDELYYNQIGEREVNILARGLSKNTKRKEPLIWTYKLPSKTRVFQSLLGHDKAGYSPIVKEVTRRGIFWTVKNLQHE